MPVSRGVRVVGSTTGLERKGVAGVGGYNGNGGRGNKRGGGERGRGGSNNNAGGDDEKFLAQINITYRETPHSGKYH